MAGNLLFKGISQRWTVTLNGETVTGDFALAAVCNGRYYGGGSMPAPRARMDDGVLDAVLVKAVSRLTFARLFGPYSEGRCEEFSHIARVTPVRELRIRGEDGELTVCLDGECFQQREVTLRLSDRRLNFFGPAGCDCNRTAR